MLPVDLVKAFAFVHGPPEQTVSTVVVELLHLDGANIEKAGKIPVSKLNQLCPPEHRVSQCILVNIFRSV